MLQETGNLFVGGPIKVLFPKIIDILIFLLVQKFVKI